MNCTPSQAIEELRGNPWIWDVLAEHSYRHAWLAVEQWDAMDHKQRERSTPPSGLWVRMVAKHRRRMTEAKMAARNRELETAGR